MSTKLWFVSTGYGCGIREGQSEESVRREELREVGTYSGVREVRRATPDDIAWVRSMGGHVPEVSTTDIHVRYRSIDRYAKSRRFKTIEGARRFAHRYVGAHPELGSSYAVSTDGVGTIYVSGCTLAELFPPKEAT